MVRDGRIEQIGPAGKVRIPAGAEKIDVTLVVDMLLTGFDSKFLNTLYVDKTLKHHGLIQAFSRTDRVLNDTKPHGHILDFRGQEAAVDEAIVMFSGVGEGTDARQIWLVEPAKEVAKKLKGSSQKVRRAQILLKADADGPSWTDAKIAEAVGCRTKTVENIRERFVTLGFEVTLEGKCRERAPRPKTLDGEQEAQVIAMRLGLPPKGFANWSLRLLAEKVVELAIVESISHETIRQTLKKAD